MPIATSVQLVGEYAEEAPGPSGIGLAAGAEARLWRALHAEAGLQAGASGEPSPVGAAWAGLRLYPAPPSRERALLSVGAALGGGWRGDPVPHAWTGAAVEAPLRAGPAIRVEAGYRFDLPGTDGASFLRVGLVSRPRGPAATPEPAPVVASTGPPAPEEAPPPPPRRFEPEGALVWIPHPWCEWVPASQAHALLGSLPGDTRVEVLAPGYLPTVADSGGGDVRLAPAPRQGTVVVVGSPGDRFRVGDADLPPSPSGVAVAAVPEGPVAVEVLGGGRGETLEGAVGAGYALWLRASRPPPVEVRFAEGSAQLSGVDRRRIADMAARRGDAGFDVVGSASADGTPDGNTRLADARARAVADALVAAGVPDEHVRVLPPVAGDPASDPTGDRFARIQLRSTP
ncbi:MAG: OmpA family protein [Myxococcota bacterium]